MSWNHRVMKHTDPKTGEVWYGIHEVYYDESGKMMGYTTDAMEPFGESIEELKRDIIHFLKALRKPVLTYEYDDETDTKDVP